MKSLLGLVYEVFRVVLDVFRVFGRFFFFWGGVWRARIQDIGFRSQHL